MEEASASPSTLTSPLTLNSPTSAISNHRKQRATQSIFGNPSNNNSEASLSGFSPNAASTSRPSPLRNRSYRADAGVGITSPLSRHSQLPRNQPSQNERERTDALWAEMQATLAEVELSAARGNHFFGPEHSTALEELRNSQISLAQAWARSEADETVDHSWDAEAEASRGKSPRASVHQGAEEGDGKEMERETDRDILLARKRREANDRYFWRVRNGVLDVVGKLEEVAVAMGKVERESREIWSESEGMESEASTA